MLTDFLNIEMTFHARALENLAKCFENVAMIDEFSDVEVSICTKKKHLRNMLELFHLNVRKCFWENLVEVLSCEIPGA